MNITEAFIDGLIAKANEIPQPVTDQAKKCLLDYLGVLIGGRKYIRDAHPELFDAFEDAAPYHALVNGFCAHVLELDDGHRHGMIHLGASIVTAVLEATKCKAVPYEKILCGIVMGYEAAVRCARSIQPGHKVRGYHVSGTCGTIGSAMAIAFAFGYSKEQIKSTLACAVSSAAGVLEIQEQASEMKPYNVGRAAMDGLVAALMGRMALPGPNDIQGGKRGFLAALTDTPHSEYLTDFSTEDYAIKGIYQKVHAACRHCHPAIDATLDMRRDLRLQPEQIERIEVHTYKLAVGSHDHTDIRGISSAKLSTPYAVALAIVRGSAGYADYNENNLNDYWIKNLTQKVNVVEDENLTEQSPAVRGAKVAIYLKDGGVFEAPCLYPKGEPENPLTQEGLEEKFRGLAMYGGMTIEDCNQVIAEIKREKLDFNTIINCCRL
ncbi:2-methylcitrate dehydratase PrpD [Prevotella sp. khp7]|uniref:MmgE/PrpD family protein n=1 Tax=Prevotella sp. khp7 TaxID=1761885 RepID=UPI0008B63FF5|nr:MmgE/PrpD family protein [Prevotella sp. khp7]SEW24133.1 2-methylcitrate dehydratase PrpD [Prevotella sp. khp7]